MKKDLLIKLFIIAIVFLLSTGLGYFIGILENDDLQVYELQYMTDHILIDNIKVVQTNNALVVLEDGMEIKSLTGENTQSIKYCNLTLSIPDNTHRFFSADFHLPKGKSSNPPQEINYTTILKGRKIDKKMQLKLDLDYMYNNKEIKNSKIITLNENLINYNISKIN